MDFVKYSEKLFSNVGTVIIPFFEDEVPTGTKYYDAGNRIVEITKKADFKGIKMEVLETFNPESGRKDIAIGLGKKKEFDRETLRRAYSLAFKAVKTSPKKLLAVIIPGLEPDIETKEIVFTLTLTSYDFDRFKKEKNKTKIEKVLVLTNSDESVIKEAKIVADAVNFTRDVANLPPSTGTPTYFEKEAKNIPNLSVTALSRADFLKLGMGGLEGVSRAASEKAKLLIMEYGPKDKKPLLIVGKGITFDSGGISIKPSDGMDQMKFDKCGASAVLGTMKLVSNLKLRKHVVGMAPLTENLPGGNAYKPGDILTHYNGVTSEVLSTDAEGRLVLADALSYGIKKFNPSEVIDLATLTGACVVALGNNYAGLMGNNDTLKERIKKASSKTWERVWELPLDEDFQEQIKSKVADIKNTGGREGGAETAGAFLSRFVGSTPWVHLDIAGTAWTQKNTPKQSYLPPGATGFGVRLLYEYLKDKSD